MTIKIKLPYFYNSYNDMSGKYNKTTAAFGYEINDCSNEVTASSIYGIFADLYGNRVLAVNNKIN